MGFNTTPNAKGIFRNLWRQLDFCLASFRAGFTDEIREQSSVDEPRDHVASRRFACGGKFVSGLRRRGLVLQLRRTTVIAPIARRGGTAGGGGR